MSDSPQTNVHLLAVGLNPAWQKTLHFADIILGEVNRASRMDATASGKGINFTRALIRLGYAGTVAQFAGCQTGQQLCAELDAHGMPHLTVWTEALTRTCTTLLSSTDQSMTELIEPAGDVTPDDVRKMHSLITQHLATADGLALCGTYPPGVPETLYADVICRATAHDIPVLLDAYKGVSSAFAAGPHIVKVNDRELKTVTNQPDLHTAAKIFFRTYPVHALGVTAGPRNAYLFTRERAWTFSVPKLDMVVSPLGAGDTANAVFLARLADIRKRRGLGKSLADILPAMGENLPDIFATALATASASCLTASPAAFDPAEAAKLKRQIRIKQWPWPWPYQ